MFRRNKCGTAGATRQDFHRHIIAGLSKTLEGVPAHERAGVILQSVVLSQIDLLVKVEAAEARLMRANALLTAAIALATVALLIGN